MASIVMLAVALVLALAAARDLVKLANGVVTGVKMMVREFVEVVKLALMQGDLEQLRIAGVAVVTGRAIN